ncbi:hypothetical protein [Prescottella subtropica]|uniref:hypothetical protein n=1 Tax=Prescottella subtropica TaxID=2545757 RepID=UPI0010F51D9C|nr:hypothetical protein [Prescottella subtropica]
MSDVWVDPERLTAAAAAVGAAGDGMRSTKIVDVQILPLLEGASVADACTTGSRTAGRVVEMVAELLGSWSQLVGRTADDYARTDTATADLLLTAGDRR